MSKKQWLEKELGQHMQESAGSMLGEGDRFVGFIPGESSSGEMSLDRIIEDDEQPRRTYDDDALQLFAEQLKQHGIQQPIQLRWSDRHDKWMIVYGHRRFRAAKLAGFETIPCLFADEDLDETTLRVRQLVENCQRENLKPLEMAQGLKSLRKLTGWSHRQMGSALGLNHATISRSLDLLRLPDDLKERVDREELAPSLAVSVLKLKSTNARRKVGHRIADEKLNRKKATALIESVHNGSDIQTEKSTFRKPDEIVHQSPTLLVYRSSSLSDEDLRSELQRLLRKIETELAL